MPQPQGCTESAHSPLGLGRMEQRRREWAVVGPQGCPQAEGQQASNFILGVLGKDPDPAHAIFWVVLGRWENFSHAK